MALTFVSREQLIQALSLAPWPIRRAIFTRRYKREINRTGEAELLLLRTFLKSGDLCLDIGANLGTYAFELGRLTGNCIAFEPNPHLARIVRGLRLEGVDLRQLAAADAAGTSEFAVPRSKFGHALGRLRANADDGTGDDVYTVKTIKIDDLGLRDLRFVKIDVEGFEEGVLRGAVETIQRDMPILLIEIEERQNPGGLARITRSLSSYGYSGYFYDEGWIPIKDFEASRHQPAGGDDPDGQVARRSLRFFNNFLFAQEDPRRSAQRATDNLTGPST